MSEPLIDCHAHLLHGRCGRSDWQEVNAARLRAGERIGITYHVASMLGSYGFTSPTYFPSPEDVTFGNDQMIDLCARDEQHLRMMVTVNPNYTGHALREIRRCLDRSGGNAIGVKVLASRRADDPLLDPIGKLAGEYGLPILHHVWQHRRREWPSQEISDGADLTRLAERHPAVSFILAHLGGGGDYRHTFHAVRDYANVYLDLSGSGVDRGMLDDALQFVGPRRLLWGTDVTMETGLAKLRALAVTGQLTEADEQDIRWRNATRIFRVGAFPNAQ